MIKKIILVILLFLSFAVYSQKTLENSFEIKANSSSFSNQFIAKAMLNAEFEPFRDREKTVVLSFSNGFTIELMSAKKLAIKGMSLNPNNYEIKSSFFLTRACTLLESGYIMVAAPTAPDTKSKLKK
jgi:hypothetical protein